MAHGNAYCAGVVTAILLFSGAAIAQSASGGPGTGSAPGAAAGQETGMTTGPAAGTDVEPSTAIQKDYEGRSTSDSKAKEVPLGTPAAAGMPGAEGAPGTQSGPAGK